jgi:hypothetical protein
VANTLLNICAENNWGLVKNKFPMLVKTLVFLICLVPENLLLRVYHAKTKKKWEG